MNIFEEMGAYWAEIADQNPTQRQTQFMRDTLKPTGRVLDLACGTGRHLIPLSKEDYNIVGLDTSLRLLRIAKTRQSGIQLVRADMRRLPFKSETFAAAVSMDTSLGYLPSDREDTQSLKELRQTLEKEGVLIVDVFNREQLTRKYAKRRQVKWIFLPLLLKLNGLGERLLFRFFSWREYPSFFLLQKRTVDTDGSKLRDLWIVCDKADEKMKVFKHAARLYERRVLERLLEQAGFAVGHVYGGYGEEQFSPDSDRLILIASAKSPKT